MSSTNRNPENNDEIFISETPIFDWFELTYAQFLTIPRLVMQSMPVEWQNKMVAPLNEVDKEFDWRPQEGHYWVSQRDDQGRFVELNENICDYRHGNIEHLRKNKCQ
jgi:hypothetical protein